MFADNNNYGYFPIRGNTLVIIKSPLTHKVNKVLTSIIPRISIQIFMK